MSKHLSPPFPRLPHLRSPFFFFLPQAAHRSHPNSSGEATGSAGVGERVPQSIFCPSWLLLALENAWARSLSALPTRGFDTCGLFTQVSKQAGKHRGPPRLSLLQDSIIYAQRALPPRSSASIHDSLRAFLCFQTSSPDWKEQTTIREILQISSILFQRNCYKQPSLLIYSGWSPLPMLFREENDDAKNKKSWSQVTLLPYNCNKVDYFYPPKTLGFS